MPSAAELLPLLDRARDEVPGVELFDAHTHLGANDPDGFHCTRAELVELLERADARAVVFPMHEPDGYSAANDMVLAEAEASGSLLVPFSRLDPPTTRSPRPSVAWRRARAGSSSTPAPRASRSTIRRCRRVRARG